jgi:Transposase DDE domain
VVEKPYARLLGEAAWVWSSQQQKGVFGVSVVLLVWTDGQIRIPVAYRVWQKGGPSKIALAIALLSSARHRLKCKPQGVLFDSWYPARRLLKRLRDYGWYCVGQLKRSIDCVTASPGMPPSSNRIGMPSGCCLVGAKSLW